MKFPLCFIKHQAMKKYGEEKVVVQIVNISTTWR